MRGGSSRGERVDAGARAVGSWALLAVTAALVAAGSAGCRAPIPDHELVQRWIAEAPADELLVSQLEGIECVVESRFEGGEVPAGLVIEDATPLLATGARGLTLRGGERPPVLRFGRHFAPGEIDAVRLAISGVRRGNVRLRWFTANAREPAGTLELTKAQGGGSLHSQFFFDLANRLPTDGPIVLEIEPTSAAGELVTLNELCVGRARLDTDRVAVASRVAWKATLADEARDVLVQPPGGALVRRVALSRPSVLAVGFGRLSGSSPAVRLRVSASGAGTEPRILLERRLAAGDMAAGWLDFDIDLADLSTDVAMRDLELRLEATSEPPGDPAFVAAWSAPRVVASGARSKRPNIVLISLDTLRADHLSLYGYGRETSPLLDAWVRERRGTVFRHVAAPSGWTLPSHFSLFTGLEAFRHPANYNTVALDTSAFSFLAERLLAAGYRTQAFTAGGFVHPIYGLSKGFESFVYWASKERRSEELESNLRLAGKWLDRIEATPGGGGEASDPFLLFLHTYEIHTPYTARQPYFGNFSRLPADLIVDFESDGDLLQRGFLGTSHSVMRRAPGAPGELLPTDLAALPADLYDSAIAYVDAKLQPFLRRLSEPPFDRDTIIVLFSDHGETLGENGRAGHANLELNNLLVPLIVVRPGVRRAREIPSQVRLIDLFPTLLELADLDVPPGIDGQSLLGLLSGAEEAEGRPALAYAPSTNHGLSLLAPGGLKLDWRNSLWKPIAGDLLWYRRDGLREIPLAAAPATPEADRMVRQIQQAYARGSNGLRFELENLSSRALRVGVTSDLVDPSTVKSPRVDGVRLDWRYIGYLEAELGARATLALQFERPQRREVELELRIQDASCAGAAVTTSVALAFEQLRQPLRRQLELPACAGASAGAGLLRLEVGWQGPLPSSEGMRTDEALREDLAALGYIH